MPDNKIIDGLTSEYNEASFQIYRLHIVWTKCREYRQSGNIIGWKDELNSAEIELSTDALRLDGKIHNKENGWLERIKKANTNIEETKKIKEYISKKKAINEFLKDKEILLRNLQEEAGKGTKFRFVDEEHLL